MRLVVCVDRDDDLGRKAGVVGPVVGRANVLDAALKLGTADPEDADTNAMFAAVHLLDQIRETGEDAEVVVLTGSPKVGTGGQTVPGRLLRGTGVSCRRTGHRGARMREAERVRGTPQGHEGRTREDQMDDAELIQRITQLADEEHQLERSHTGDGLSDAEQDRLRSIEVALDQCWDVLRQRRARRNAGQDPDTAAVRSADVVEHYQQ